MAKQHGADESTAAIGAASSWASYTDDINGMNVYY